MASTDILYFKGHRWPAARIADRSDKLVEPKSHLAADLETRSVATIATTGSGRVFEAIGAQGFWRTFSEIDFGNDHAIAEFCQRYGDPMGSLSPKSPVHDAGWFQLWERLSDLARAWSPAGSDGISRVSEPDPTDRISKVFPRWDEADFGATRLRFDPQRGMQIQFSRPAGFMVASAVTQLQARTPLRRCDVCGHWHSFARSTSKTCSAACRNILSRRNKEPKNG